MIEKRFYHDTVSMGNKMFVIGGYKTTACEVFDSHSRKFTSIKPFLTSLSMLQYFQAVTVGKNIFVFHILENSSKTNMYMYDVDKKNWLNVDCGFCKNLFGSSCVKYYTD